MKMFVQAFFLILLIYFYFKNTSERLLHYFREVFKSASLLTAWAGYTNQDLIKKRKKKNQKENEKNEKKKNIIHRSK